MNASEFEKGKEIDADLNESEIFSAILKRIGGGGKWQWIIFCIASYSGTALALGNLSSAFIAGVPDYWCNVPESDGGNISTFNTTLPLPTCSYYLLNGTTSAEAPVQQSPSVADQSVQHIQCTSWEYDDAMFENTIVSEWDLVCNDKWKKSTAQAIFMIGVLLGGLFLSELSDIYGRRYTILLASMASILSTGAVALSTGYVSFVALRFISAIFVTGVFLPSFVLLMEIVDRRNRTLMGILFQVPFSIGVLILPGIAYFIKSWRYLQIAIAVLTAMLILNFWMLPESPRWLVLQGRSEEAFKILKRAGRRNATDEFDENALEILLMKLNQMNSIQDKRTGKQHFVEFFTNMYKLVKTPIIRRRSIITCYQYFVVATVYYGLIFPSDTFSSSPHVMLTIGGVGDIVGVVSVIYILAKFGRRNTLAVAFVVCGIACVCVPFIPSDMKWVIISLGTLGKVTNSMAFAVVFVYSAELMPTPIRNVALGMGALFARLGSAIVPYILDMLGALNPIIPPALFGIISLLAGAVTLLLPESANKPLPETIEEVESLKK